MAALAVSAVFLKTSEKVNIFYKNFFTFDCMKRNQFGYLYHRTCGKVIEVEVCTMKYVL
jgi:hypothetical protein